MLRVGFDLAAQPRHAQVDAAVAAVVVARTGGLEQPLACQWPVRMLAEQIEQIEFGRGQWLRRSVRADQQPALDQMCRVMKASDIKLFRIMGHTDSAGSDAYNEKLSLLRAEEVKRRLTSDCGIAATRLDAIGLGERFPANATDPKAPQNRRVEFQALS